MPALPATEAPRPAVRDWPLRLVHGWALLTAGATFVLLGAGSLVTTLRVGMADPGWPSPPWFLFFLTPADHARGVGFLVEHSHRLAGYVVGSCVIGLAVGLWLVERRRWVCWLGTGALVAICIQGLVGGLRVLENDRFGRELAAGHGSFAQLVCALLVGIALFTSRWWRTNSVAVAEESLRRLAFWTAVAAYLQVVFGVILRHTYSGLGQRLHLLGAFGLVALVSWLVKRVLVDGKGHRRLRVAVGCLATLILVQLMLGIETWISRFSSGTGLPETQVPTLQQAWLMTAHFLVGTLLFATSVTGALLSARRERFPRAAQPSDGYSEGPR